MSGMRFLIRTMRLLAPLFLAANLFVLTCSAAADDPEVGSLNKQERLEWFRDQGFGLFIHWSVDSQLGVVISHSLVGASPEYTNRFFRGPDQDLRSARVSSSRMGSVGASGWRPLCHVHHQASFRLRHVRHHDDSLWHHEHAISSRYHQGGLQRFSCSRRCSGSVFFTRRFLVASSEWQDHQAVGSRGPAAQ